MDPMQGNSPFVRKRRAGPFVSVEGVFYRGIDPAYRQDALGGSRVAGRYSSPDRPTLYVSASLGGVRAAMVAHAPARSAALQVVTLDVAAQNIFDLRDERARSDFGISLEDAMAPWQDVALAGGEPPSWRVRRQLEQAGAMGLIDPSRKAPTLWHLVLFAWNSPGAPTVGIR